MSDEVVVIGDRAAAPAPRSPAPRGNRARGRATLRARALSLLSNAPVMLLFVAAAYSAAHVFVWWGRSDLFPDLAPRVRSLPPPPAVLSIVIPSPHYDTWSEADQAVHQIGLAALSPGCPSLQVVLVGCLRPLPEFARATTLSVVLVSACPANFSDTSPEFAAINPVTLYVAAARHISAPFVLFAPPPPQMVTGFPKFDYVFSAAFLKSLLRHLESVSGPDIIGAASVDESDNILLAGLGVSRLNSTTTVIYERDKGLHARMVKPEDPIYRGEANITSVFVTSLVGSAMTSALWSTLVADRTPRTTDNVEAHIAAISKAIGARYALMDDYYTRAASHTFFTSFHSLMNAALENRAAAYARDQSRQALSSLNVVWDLYCGCTGLNNEAINLLVPLERHVNLAAVAGPSCWCPGYPEYVRNSLQRITERRFTDISVWVSHKPPKNYPTFPYHGLWRVSTRPKYVIGRSMWESTPLPAGWLTQFQLVDEVWVPSEWQRQSFALSGVSEHKLHVVPEPIDPRLYDPDVVQPLELPLPASTRVPFRFLSVFKWEARKAPEILLKAYWSAFKPTDDVVLYLHTFLYNDVDKRNPEKIAQKIREVASSLGLKQHFERDRLPPVVVLNDELPAIDMPRLYKAANAFVLPTRGEGWGMPIMEAMTMGLPTIATNWSGCTMLVDEKVAYPLEIEGLETADGFQRDRPNQPQWAKPSAEHLTKLMREIFYNKVEASLKGVAARKKWWSFTHKKKLPQSWRGD